MKAPRIQPILTVPSQARPAGFTLVELLISITVLAMLTALLAQILSSVSNSWIRSRGAAERQRHARAITDFMASELQLALLPVERADASGKGNLQLVVNPAQLGSDYRHADAIFWHAPAATETSHGDIAAVGYFVKWFDGGTRPILCRFFANPSQRVDGELQPNPCFRVYDANPDAWLDPQAVVDQVVQPTNKILGYRGHFAENIIGLWVQCYGTDGQALPRDYNSREGYLPTSSVSPNSQEPKYLPGSVKISLALVDSAHAPRLAAAAAPLRSLTQSPGIRDAGAFLTQVQSDARTSPTLAALLPGLRTYAVEVRLQNAR